MRRGGTGAEGDGAQNARRSSGMAVRVVYPRAGLAKNLLLFPVLWVMAGVTLGVVTLLGPYAWLREADHADPESTLARSLAAAVVIVSALVAAWMGRGALRSGKAHVRVGVPALALVSAAASVWVWVAAPTAAPPEVGPEVEFTFGPYPGPDGIAELSREGFTAFVSLLHPAWVPVEPELNREARQAAETAGIEFVHIPMVPWLEEGSEAEARLGALAQREGRYYVHYHLGRDGIRLARDVIERATPGAVVRVEAEPARPLAAGLKLTRGEVIEVAEGVLLLPYPTDKEFLRYVVGGSLGRVVALLDPSDPDDAAWIRREKDLLRAHRLDLTVLPIAVEPYDASRALDVAREIAALRRPVLVHAFLSASSGRSPVAEAFLQAYRSDLPPLPSGLFAEPMLRGPVRVIAPNVAAGPRPTDLEFEAYLLPRGVREVVRVGLGTSDLAQVDRVACETAGLRWSESEGGEDLLEKLASDGPYYLYGPVLDSVEVEIAARLGPAIPEDPRRPEEDPATRPERAEDDPVVVVRPAWLKPHRTLIERALPNARTVALLAPTLLLTTALAAGLVAWLRKSRQVRAAYTRKLFHFIVFSLAAVLHGAAGLPAVMLLGVIGASAVLYATARGTGFSFYEALARPSDAPLRKLFVLLPLATTAVGGLLANALFGPFAYVGYLVAGWGDAAGEPVGVALGRHRYRVPSLGRVRVSRSLEGTLAVLLVGLAAAFLGLWLGGIPPLASLRVAAACGLAGAAVEAVSNHGLDNLTVQVAAAGVAYVLLA